MEIAAYFSYCLQNSLLFVATPLGMNCIIITPIPSVNCHPSVVKLFYNPTYLSYILVDNKLLQLVTFVLWNLFIFLSINFFFLKMTFFIMYNITLVYYMWNSSFIISSRFSKPHKQVKWLHFSNLNGVVKIHWCSKRRREIFQKSVGNINSLIKLRSLFNYAGGTQLLTDES